MTPDWIVFVVGAFVTTIWGTMVAVLLYTAGKSGSASNEGSGVEKKSDYKAPKSGNG
jgi:hypothetical protein